ncbi:hypothetical protein NY536_26970, partial [Enterobacter hormaechei]|nr:hypothetical protein [Enterobacter hormaechei]
PDPPPVQDIDEHARLRADEAEDAPVHPFPADDAGIADAQRIAEEWSDPLYWRQGTTVSAVSMVFSMPAGTDPETVNQAVREAA